MVQLDSSVYEFLLSNGNYMSFSQRLGVPYIAQRMMLVTHDRLLNSDLSACIPFAVLFVLLAATTEHKSGAGVFARSFLILITHPYSPK